MLDIIVGGEPGGILVFLPGEQEIKTMATAIGRRLTDVYGIEPDGVVQIVQVTARNVAECHLDIFGPAPVSDDPNLFGRKVIIATNVAETSITFTDHSFFAAGC